ncbi:helix-turn-helix transcriptional regulator [Candidatus Nanohalococcus occultus]|uniref:Transcriptional regulator n=1 Tax=Candidatus Nanohalococcus occultus TaxID=2978047 RepID=A0ABY8CDG0_9ARCH|nr:Putative transcriptional regulator [Candidatus Nanohaloarchaeota archaeon SVXNc]
MRKLFVAVVLTLLVSSATATTIGTEAVSVDLESSEVNIELHVEELTSSRLTYFTYKEIEDLSVTVDGKELDCQVYSSESNNQISCETSAKNNFTAHISYSSPDLVRYNGNTREFSLEENFIRPTRNYTLTVLLPRGDILAPSDGNASVQPSNAEISTDGQRISVKWSENPELGTSSDHKITYQGTQGGNRILELLGALVVISLILLAGYFGIRKLREEDLDSVYEKLEDDEREVIELLRDNEGSMLQKDLVSQMDYSKAKISGTVSSLVEKEVVRKEKEGRSNRVSIRKNYRF